MGRSTGSKALVFTASCGDEASHYLTPAPIESNEVCGTCFCTSNATRVINNESSARQLFGCDSAADDGRPLGHSKLNDHQQSEDSACTNRNPLKKIEENRTYAHSSIVQRSSWKSEITMRIGLSCAQFQISTFRSLPRQSISRPAQLQCKIAA